MKMTIFYRNIMSIVLVKYSLHNNFVSFPIISHFKREVCFTPDSSVTSFIYISRSSAMENIISSSFIF